jgi:TolB-like protein/predicted Zn-dependent protease
MSNDPEQEPFVDGLTEDLITDLSRATGLFVIARNSTFAYKGRTVDVRQTARVLGVRYLVEGSARRAAGRVRINAQLIDAVGGDHLWADRFDRSLEDIFAVQDEVTGKIVEALVGRLTTPPARNRPTNIEAYDLCVQARGLSLQTAVAAREAILLLERAILLDPDYAEAHRWLGINLWFGWAFWNEAREPNPRARAMAEAQRAVVLDPNDAGNRWVLGIILGHEGRSAESDAEFEATFKLDPNHADAWAMRSDLLTFSGQATEAIEHVLRALRLNPHPPGWYYWMLGQAQYVLHDYASAVHTLRRPETHRTTSRRTLAAALAQLGRLEDARREVELFMMSNPHFTIRQWADSQPFRDEKTRQHFVDGYRKAGLPG